MARRDRLSASGKTHRTWLIKTTKKTCDCRLLQIGIAGCVILCLTTTANIVVQANTLIHHTVSTSQLVLGQVTNPPQTPESKARSRLFPPFFRRNKQLPAALPSDPLQITQDQPLTNSTDLARLRANDYLEKGRASLSQGNLSGAVAWYQKAVAENASFGPNDYRPEQLLQELKTAGIHNLPTNPDALNPPTIQPPSHRTADFPSLVNTESFDSPGRAIPTLLPDPQNIPNAFAFSPRPGEILNPAVTGPGSFPTSQNALAIPHTVHNNIKNHGNIKNRGLLFEARLALAAGHVGRANNLAQQAKNTGVTSPLHRDTPQRVTALIRQYHQLGKTPSTTNPAETNYQRANLYMQQAEGLLDYGDLETAMQLAKQAEAQQASFSETEKSPAQLIQRISLSIATKGQSKSFGPAAPVPHATNAISGDSAASTTLPFDRQPEVIRSNSVTPVPRSSNNVAQAIYDPATDQTHNESATALVIEPAIGQDYPVGQIIQQGERALADNQLNIAKSHFLRALNRGDQLNPSQKQQLEDRLQIVNARSVSTQDNLEEPSSLSDTETRRAVAWRQWINEIAYQQRQAQRLGQEDPIAALDTLKDLRERVKQSELTRNEIQTLVARVDVSIGRLEKYIGENQADIELDQQNKQVKNEINLNRQNQVTSQQKLAQLVEDFNELLEQERYSEAELLARQARQIDPENPVTDMMLWNAKFIKHHARNLRINELSEEGFDAAMEGIERAGIPFNTEVPFQFGDPRDWKDIKERRSKNDQQTRYTKAELEIQRRLKTQVEVRFDNRPLQEVMNTLAKLANVNIFLDPRGLAAEAVTTNEPIDINLTGNPISLHSALTLILEPLGLNYVIQNEVLKITSAQMRDSDVFSKVYIVADLVTPIPNFNPSYNIGLPAAIQSAHQAIGYGNSAGAYNSPLAMAAADTTQPDQAQNPSTLAQMLAPGMPLPGQSGGVRGPMGFGPGAPGGAAEADFESLIELITTTIAPDSWDEVGGPGAIQEFEGNLSLVISQTQDVHDQIADLLEQLRRLQDLQVTIEVRFITLADDFYERLGIDFDFDIEDNTGRGQADALDAMGKDDGPSLSVGLNPTTGLPTADLDLKFNQGSFGGAIPAFGGFDPMTAATFGFAILSDIEAFFVISAAHGDTRTNVMQSPKVTLFNGQQASVMDITQKPFVTSIIPVVGDFAAAHQPVITVLSSGTQLSVQAVVSPDRRFVRLTLVPFFSQIGHVNTFTFNGRTSSNSGTMAVDPTDDEQNVQNEVETITEGTTVQLPEFAFTTVTTTVSVPDGGTVLLGGIKRLKEGRTEKGVPMLSKLPYINRLFTNVGVGREASSLMLMVTPRIIIQEEEEELLLGGAAP